MLSLVGCRAFEALGGTEMLLWVSGEGGRQPVKTCPEGSRELWEALEQSRSRVRRRDLRLQAGQRLVRRKPELRPRPSEVGALCRVTSPSSKRSSWLLLPTGLLPHFRWDPALPIFHPRGGSAGVRWDQLLRTVGWGGWHCH